jgi:magnesium transporter
MRTLVTTRGAFHEPTAETIHDHLANCHVEGFWMDIEAPDEDDYEILSSAFKFHALTVEDVKHGNQRPKLDEYRGYSFMVLFEAVFKEDRLDFDEYFLYLADDYLVTVHAHPQELLASLRKRIEAEPETTKDDPKFLTYLVVDELIDANFPVLDRLDLTIDELEDLIIDKAQPEQLKTIYTMKHDISRLRQLLGAQRDLFQRLITSSLDPDEREMGLYYRDVYDHIIRQYEAVDSLRDLLSGAMDVYLSTVSNRLNVTMRSLTVIASLFLPLTFLSGFYGMNFEYLTKVLEPPYVSFWIGVGTMVIATIIQFYFFKRRGWL